IAEADQRSHADEKEAEELTMAKTAKAAAKPRIHRASKRSRSNSHPPGEPSLDGFRVTHPGRVLYPDVGATKGGLAAYYTEVADWILPHLGGRPLTLVRCPEGMSGQCFYQKPPPAGMPASVERIAVPEKDGTATYCVVNDLDGLIALVQL